ncbi:agmatinase [Lachnospiraceae bacterium KM106-2]|nr:agmatinase [Lachnospiraceae bacterium KM106-2]
MWNKNVYTFLGCEQDFEESSIVIFGAPYDSTTSNRPGTRFASAAMRQESYGLETYSPYLDRDMEDYCFYDGGDLELSFGNSEKTLQIIEDYCDKVLSDKKLPLMIGGEHLVTLGSFRAIAKHYPDIHVIHFDAHTDLRDSYLDVTLSHACVIRRIHDLIGDHRIHQFGIRSGEREEFQFGKLHNDLHPFSFEGLETTIEFLKGKPIYLTIDLDVLDPSIFPGTGTPEAGGVNFLELIHAIKEVSKLKIVGCDLTELAPMLDSSGVSTAVACKVLRELLLSLTK